MSIKELSREERIRPCPSVVDTLFHIVQSSVKEVHMVVADSGLFVLSNKDMKVVHICSKITRQIPQICELSGVLLHDEAVAG